MNAIEPGAWRDRFHIPRSEAGEHVYLCTHSLGLQPRDVERLMRETLSHWATLGVEGHFHGPDPWYGYERHYRDWAAKIVGAQASEVVLMNGLTVNQHLMLATFFHPTKTRYKILVDAPTFPSDLYALQSQLAWHGLDPSSSLEILAPRDGEDCLRPEDILERIRMEGERIAIVALSGVNFLTGQAFDLQAITAMAHEYGCTVGFDLAHAAGNVELHLHDWEVDYATWCTYKYLCSGPGAVAGCFVHSKHGDRLDLSRLAGWWGNDPAKRFRMHLEPLFVPQEGAGGWQVSNPPILALVPLRASHAIFDEIGMPTLRRLALELSTRLLDRITPLEGAAMRVVTPREPTARGCQLSLQVNERPKELLERLKQSGVILDFREPNLLRVAPSPLYNTLDEVDRFAEILSSHLA